MSEELRTFLVGKGVATGRSTSYNPQENGQVEKYNGIIWKAIVTSLKSKNLPVKYWQEVLADSLHSVRSLLCTATNETHTNVSWDSLEDRPWEARCLHG